MNYFNTHTQMGSGNNSMDMIAKAARVISQSKNIVVLTGAGMSTESGLPDFRSNGGLWDGQKPEEISHWSKVGTKAFREFFSRRITDIQEHEPNEGHRILANWQKDRDLTIITQNIDGYHQAAGAKRVIEMHGHMRTLICDTCETRYDTSMYTKFNHDECESTYDGETCFSGTIRPEVILFGEDLPALEWFQSITKVKEADLVIVLGTSLQVFPFNELVSEAYNGGNGARVMIITQSETPYDLMASVRIHDPITETLSAIDKALLEGNE